LNLEPASAPRGRREQSELRKRSALIVKEIRRGALLQSFQIAE